MDSMPIKKRKIEMIDISCEDKPEEKIIKPEKMEEFTSKNNNNNNSNNNNERDHQDEKENEKKPERSTISPGLLYDLDLHATVEKKISDPIVRSEENQNSSNSSESDFTPMPPATTIEPPSIPLNPVPTLRLVEERTTEKIYVCDQDYQNYNYNNYNFNYSHNPNNNNSNNSNLHPFSVQRIVEREFHVQLPHADSHFPPLPSHPLNFTFPVPTSTSTEPQLITGHNTPYENLSNLPVYYHNYTEEILQTKTLDENFPPPIENQFLPPHPYENPHQDLILWNPGLPDQHQQQNQSISESSEILKTSKNLMSISPNSDTKPKFLPRKFETPQHFTDKGPGSGKECPTCGKIIRSDMKRHMKIHSGLKTVTCSVCDRKFARRDHLAVHLKKVHGQ